MVRTFVSPWSPMSLRTRTQNTKLAASARRTQTQTGRKRRYGRLVSAGISRFLDRRAGAARLPSWVSASQFRQPTRASPPSVRARVEFSASQDVTPRGTRRPRRALLPRVAHSALRLRLRRSGRPPTRAGWRDRVVRDRVVGVQSVLLGEATVRQVGASVGPAAAVHGGVESAASAARRALPSPSGEQPPLTATDGEALGRRSATTSREDGAPVKKPRRENRSWSEMMRRVFGLDVMECARCGGRLCVLAAIQDPEAIRAILDCLGLPSRPPPPPGPTLSDLF